MLARPRTTFPSRGAARIIPAPFLRCFLVHFLPFGDVFLHFSVLALCYQTMVWPSRPSCVMGAQTSLRLINLPLTLQEWPKPQQAGGTHRNGDSAEIGNGTGNNPRISNIPISPQVAGVLQKGKVWNGSWKEARGLVDDVFIRNPWLDGALNTQ